MAAITILSELSPLTSSLGLVQRLGHRADVAPDGDAAISMARENDYDPILTDINMLGTDGLSATQQIRALSPAHARIPIIALTASATATDREGCLRAGMNDFLTKPVDAEALRATLDRWTPAPSVAWEAAATLHRGEAGGIGTLTSFKLFLAQNRYRIYARCPASRYIGG